MKAIILAAGRGSRMGPLTEARPKCLVEFHGRPLLEWQLEALTSAGIDEIAVVTGYRRELLAYCGLAEFHNHRWAQTNMVSSLDCARDWLLAGPCLVSYADIIYTSAGPSALGDHPADLAITYAPDWLPLWQRRFGDPLEDAETLRLNSSGNLSEIGNKPRSLTEIQGQYMGLLRFTPRAWIEVLRLREALSVEERDRMDMTSILQRLIQSGRLPIAAVPYREPWCEVDSATDLAACEQAFNAVAKRS